MKAADTVYLGIHWKYHSWSHVLWEQAGQHLTSSLLSLTRKWAQEEWRPIKQVHRMVGNKAGEWTGYWLPPQIVPRLPQAEADPLTLFPRLHMISIALPWTHLLSGKWPEIYVQAFVAIYQDTPIYQGTRKFPKEGNSNLTLILSL